MLTYPDQTAVSTRDLAWSATNGGGENTVEGAMTAADVLDRAGLSGWNVRHAPLATAMTDDVNQMADWGVEIPNHRAVLANIGTGAPRVLGVVGKVHHAVQNEETVDMLDAIVDQSGANFVAGGTLRGGRGTFVVMKMPHGIQIGGVDAHEHYLGVTNWHDGSGALTAWTTLMRLRCTNMLNASIKGALSKWKVRHTKTAADRVGEARQALRLTTYWEREFQKMAERMMEQRVTDEEFNKIVEKVAPFTTSDQEAARERSQEKHNLLRFLFHEAPTNEVGRGTAWGAYNAFTEYADHLMPLRGGEKARGERIMVGGVDEFKQRAFNLLVPA